MRQYVIKRLLLLIPTVLGISLVIFVVVHLLPGDAADVLLGTDYDAEHAGSYARNGVLISRFRCNMSNGYGICYRGIGDDRFTRLNPFFKRFCNACQ